MEGWSLAGDRLAIDGRGTTHLFHPYYVHLAQRLARDPADPWVVLQRVKRLWDSVVGDGPEPAGYRRIVVADTTSPGGTVPVFTSCGCHPNGRHPAGAVPAPARMPGPVGVWWSSPERSGGDTDVMFRLVLFEETDTFYERRGRTALPMPRHQYMTIEAWDGIPYLDTQRPLSRNFAGQPTVVEWADQPPCEVWVHYQQATLRFPVVHRCADGTIRVDPEPDTGHLYYAYRAAA